MSVYKTIKQKIREDIRRGFYKDMKGIPLKVGDTVLDWCTGDINLGPSKHTIKSEEELDIAYISTWGLLEKVSD